MKIKDKETGYLAARLRLFADPVRLRLFLLIFSATGRNLCVSDLASEIKSSLSNTSHQLRKLELAGFVEPVRRGRMICYRARKTRAIKLWYNCFIKLMRFN